MATLLLRAARTRVTGHIRDLCSRARGRPDPAGGDPRARGEKRARPQPAPAKELTLSAAIEPHDLDTKTRQLRRWLERGARVRVTVRRGRGGDADALFQRLLRGCEGCAELHGRPRDVRGGTAAVGELRRVGGSTGTRAGTDGGGSTGTRAGRDGGGSTEIHASKDGGGSTETRAGKDGGGSTEIHASKDGGGSTGTRAGKDGGGSTEHGANTDDPACKDRVDTEKHAGKNAGVNTDDRACRGGVDTGDHVCQDGVNEEVVGNTEKHASQGGASTERAEHTRDAGRR